MKAFIIKGVIFITVIILYFSINYSLNSYLIWKNPPIINASTVIIGDSQVMTSINPDNLNDAVNIAQEAEPYAITFPKLKKIIKNNKITTLILGFSYQNLSDLNDVRFYDRFWSDEMFERYYNIANLNDLKDYRIDLMSYSKAMVKNMLLYPRKEHQKYLGHFVKSKHILDRKTQKVDNVIQRHFYYTKSESKISDLSLVYLDSIISTCNKNKIQLILINTPIHSLYKSKIPSNYKQSFEIKQGELAKRGIKIINFTDIIIEDKYFTDYNHLNYFGAEILTKELIKDLNRLNL